MKEKTAKALYVLARAVGTCPQTFYKAAKDFVDTYENEEHERRHVAQEHEQPKIGEVYRDIFGYKYVVVTENFLDGEQNRVALARVGTKGVPIFTDIFTPTLEDFMNPTFKKCEQASCGRA